MKTRQTEPGPVQRPFAHRKTFIGAVMTMLVTVTLSVWGTVLWADKAMREELLLQAQLVVRMLMPDHVKALSGGAVDLDSPSYLYLKQQLIQVRQANSKYRFLYLLGRTSTPFGGTGRQGRKMFFYVDSEPKDSPDYSPPGQVYEEASESDWRVFDTQVAAVASPVRDRWGTWVSVLVPITAPATKELIAVLGMDIDVGTWRREVLAYAALPAGLTLLLLVGLFGVLFSLLRFSDRHLVEQQAALRKNEERLKFAMEGANDGVWEIDARTKQVTLNPRGYEMFGYTDLAADPADQRFWDQWVHPDDLDKARAALEDHLSGRTPFLNIEQRLRTKSGGYLWVMSRGKVSERDAAGHPVRLTGTYTDITARKRAEEKARDAQRETAKLLAEARQAGTVLLSVLEDQKKTDEALKEERRRLASIIKGTNVGTWEWNVQSGDLVINERWAEIVGYSLAELEPVSLATWERLIDPDDQPAYNAQLERHFKGELNYYELECRMRHKDGHWVWVLDRGSVASRTGDGKPLLMSGTHTDISERKHADIYRQLSSTVLTIINEDREFRTSVQQILDAVKQATGCDAVGMRLQTEDDFPYYSESGFSSDFLQAENALAVRDPKGGVCRGPDNKVCLACICGLVLSGKTDPSNPLFTPRGSCWTNDAPHLKEFLSDAGSRLHLRNRCIEEGYQSVALIPIHGAVEIVGLLQLNGRAKNAFTLFDIKALEEIADRIGDALIRKRAETERKRLMAAIEQSGEAIMITDPQGTILYVNPAFVSCTGFSREDVLGKTPRVLKSGLQDEAFYSNLWQTITGGKMWTGRFTNKRKDGHLYTEEATISPVRDETGQIGNFVAVKRDITEHLQMSAQLIQSQKMESVGRLAGGVAHDFNNMLSVILGNTELALARPKLPPDLAAELQEVRAAAERSATLTRQLLAFARKQTAVPKVIDLTATVSGMLKMLLRLIGENIELSWLPGSGNTTVNIDPSQVDQILANLVVNARDAIGGVGKLTIETRNATLDSAFCAEHPGAQPGEYVMLVVSDTGCGMDKRTIEHIFEPFFTTKKVGEGTGLGLATVYGIVKQNHGYITVESKPRAGATFRIYLPRYMEKGGVAVVVQDTAAPRSPGHETVLLVEDEPAILNMSRTILERLGYRVLTAATPSEAIALVENLAEGIDLLLTDMVMPAMSGQDLAKRLKALLPSIKCLFMSGYMAHATEPADLKGGKMNFIQKPFSMKDLAIKLRDVLDAK